MNVFQAARGVSAVEAAQRLGIPFRQSGKRGSACCVFHAEKTPSMVLYPDDKGFHCFGCSAHGDAIDLYRQVRGLTPFEAAKEICRDFGLQWTDDDQPSGKPKPRRAHEADPRVLRMRILEFKERRIARLTLMRDDARRRMARIEKQLSRESIPFEEWWDDPHWAMAQSDEIAATEEMNQLKDMPLTDLWYMWQNEKEEQYERESRMEGA